MNRREALKRTALVMGTAVSASTVSGILQGCTAKPEISWSPSFFNEDQAVLVSIMSGVIIPATDTPGAREVGVPKFIEDMVSVVYEVNEQQEFIDGLQAFNLECDNVNGRAFVEMNSEDQIAYLESYDSRMKESMQSAERQNAPNPDLRFYYKMKELTVAGFFTSEAGATQVLQYVQIPQEYHGCISLEEAGGKTWAT